MRFYRDNTTELMERLEEQQQEYRKMIEQEEKEDPIYQYKSEINKIKTALELTDIQKRILKERYEKSGDKTRVEFLKDLDERPEFYEENLEQCKQGLK